MAALPRDKTDALLLIFTCTLVLLPFVAHSPLWINSIAGLLIAWRIYLTLNGQVMPDKLLLTIIGAVLMMFVYLHFHTWFGKDAGVTFLILLVCLKMLEMHARRDAMAVIFVCYFLLVGQLLYSQSLLTAMYLLLCICLLFSTQLAFQYHQLTPSLLKRLSGGFKIVGLAIPLTLVLFLFFPRFEGPLWGKQQNHSNGVTGLSDTMEPGNVAELALSDQIAFRVKFSTAIPPEPQLYWRGVVLDIYNGKRWSESPDGMISNSPQELSMPATGPAITQEIIMEPHNQRWLFGLDRPTRLVSSGGNNLTGVLTSYGEMRSLFPIQDRIRYTMISNLNSITTTTSLLSESEETKSLQLPAGYNPLTMQWAQQLRQTSSDPIQLANLVLHFFRDQPFRYTLSPPPLGNNQVDDFIFRTQAGFCEHYASAFVVIMRLMDVPARVVTGYQGGEINPIDGLMTIRQTDAHAWAEIWSKSYGWVRIDPTSAVSPNRVEHGFDSSFPDQGFSGLINFSQQTWIVELAKKMRLRWDATNSAWNLWVLNYNLQKQKDLLTTFTSIQHPQAAQLGVAMMIALTFIVTLLSLLLFKKKLPKAPLDNVYELFCQHMRDLGYPRLPYEGSTDYCQRLQLVFQNKKELVDFLSLYTKCKYGTGYNSNLDLNPLITLKALLKLCFQLKPSRAQSH